MFKTKTKSALKKCLETLNKDLEENQIHPSTIKEAVDSLISRKEIIKFFRKIESFYSRTIKQDIRQGEAVTLHNIGYGSTQKYIEDRLYKKIAEAMPLNSVCDKSYKYQLWYGTLPRLREYVEYARCKDKSDEVANIF
jgi:hypothetical protein